MLSSFFDLATALFALAAAVFWWLGSSQNRPKIIR